MISNCIKKYYVIRYHCYYHHYVIRLTIVILHFRMNIQKEKNAIHIYKQNRLICKAMWRSNKRGEITKSEKRKNLKKKVKKKKKGKL